MKVSVSVTKIHHIVGDAQYSQVYILTNLLIFLKIFPLFFNFYFGNVHTHFNINSCYCDRSQAFL